MQLCCKEAARSSRQAIPVITQNPVVFTDSVAHELGPFWGELRRLKNTGMHWKKRDKDYDERLLNQLSGKSKERGANLSVEERQLYVWLELYWGEANLSAGGSNDKYEL